MNNKDVARAFAQGGTTASGSNLFIDGDVIYSYGHHYPIARRWTTPSGVVVMLFNAYGSTVTTERHKRYVRDALKTHLWVIVDVYKCDPVRFGDVLEDNLSGIQTAESKRSRARSERMRHYWNRIAEDLKEQNRIIKTFINTEGSPTL